MFRVIEPTTARPVVTLQIQGRTVQARQGDTLAMALLNADVVPFRQTAVSGQPRAPLCLMGVCFDCLVEVDGQQNVQSCMVEVREGMQVQLPTGARRAQETV
nr:(2Fe-2S)-binding protein [uncultured Albidiferax sp.]